MAKLSLSTKCECGHQMESEIKIPKWTEPTIKKLNCKGCGSIYLFNCSRVRNSPDRAIRTQFEIVEISPKLLEIKKNAGVGAKLKRATSKVLGRDDLDFGVETSLDETE